MKKIFMLAALCLSFAQDAVAQCTAEILQTGPVVTCQYNTVALSATPGGVSYQWYESGVSIPGANSENYIATAATPGTIVYTVEINFGTCTDMSDPLDLVVNPTPTVTASSNSPICVGGALYLQASFVPGATYQWVGPNIFTSTFQNPAIMATTMANAGTYSVTATQTWVVNNVSYTCTSPVTTTMVTILPNPTPPTVSSNSPVCSGSSLTLSGNSPGPVTYSWNGPNGFTDVQQNPTINNVTYLNGGTYTLTIDNGFCMAQSTINVVVNASPVIAAVYVNPTYPNTNDGAITISGLVNGLNYVLNYVKNGIPQAPLTFVGMGGSFTLAGLSEGTYSDITVTPTTTGCTSPPIGPYVLVAQNPLPDDVWPGDANDDHWADNNDVLDLGLAYGATGTPRIGASLNWIAQASADWGTLQTNGAEMKHADCDGDGLVDANDQTAITQNYGMYHAKGVHVPQAKSASLPDLYFDLTGITFTAGTTVAIPIKLGTSSLPMNNILGIAAKIKVQDVTLDNAPTIDNNISWIGNNTSGSAMNFYKEVSANQTDWALVRTDHNNVSGEGTIATVTMQIPATSSGDAILYFEDVKIINTAGQEITDYNVVDDTATIVPLTLNSTATFANNISVIPNPSEGQANLRVTSSEAAKVSIHIIDMIGREVWSDDVIVTKGTSNIPLPAQLASGIYTIRTSGTSVSAVKWLKK